MAEAVLVQGYDFRDVRSLLRKERELGVPTPEKPKHLPAAVFVLGAKLRAKANAPSLRQLLDSLVRTPFLPGVVLPSIGSSSCEPRSTHIIRYS